MLAARLVASALACGLAGAAGCSKPVEATGVARLEIDPPSIDLGQVTTEVGGESAATFRLANRGSSVLRLLSVSSSCGCTVVALPAASLAPGRSETIAVRVRTGIEVGPRSSRLRVVSDDANRPEREVEIRWVVVSPLTISPPDLDFGRLRPGESARRLVAVAKAPGSERDEVHLTGSIPGGHADWDGPWKDDRTRVVACSLTAGIDVGDQAGSILLDLGGPARRTMVPVRWNVIAPVRAIPPALFAGIVAPGKAIEATIRVRSDGGETFRVRRVLVEGVEVNEPSLPTTDPAAEHELTIRWRAPAHLGVHRPSIRVETDLPATSPVTIPWSMVVQ